MTDPANARFGEPHTAREGHGLTRSEEEPGQQAGSSGPAHGGAEKFGLRWDSIEFGDSGSGESVFGPPPGGASPTDVPSYSPDYLNGSAVPTPPAAPPLPVRDTSARTAIPPLPTREPAQRSMFASPFDADYERGAGQNHPAAETDESAPTSSFAVSAAEMPPVDPRSGVLGSSTAPGEIQTPEKASWPEGLDAGSQDPEDTVRRIAESLGIDPGRQSRSRSAETQPAESSAAEASPADPPGPRRADSAESDASSTASVPAPPKLPTRLSTPAQGIARTEPADAGTETAATPASTETTRRPIPRAARRARDNEQPTASTATSRLSGEIPATTAAEPTGEGRHGTARPASPEPSAATSAPADAAETRGTTASDDESATGRATSPGGDADPAPAPSAATPPTGQPGDDAPRSTTATESVTDGDHTPHSTRAASVADSARNTTEPPVAEANPATDDITEEDRNSPPAARLPHRHSNEPVRTEHAETTAPAHSGAADGADRADSADPQAWQNTDTLPAIRSRAESADATSRAIPTRNGATVGLRSAPASTFLEQSDTDILRRRAAQAPAAEYVPTSRHRSPAEEIGADDHPATESAEAVATSHDSVIDEPTADTGGRRNRRATNDHLSGSTPTDLASRTGVPPTSRRAARRRAETTGEPPAIDVGLVMQLLLASHTLENVARNAEAGDVDLNGLITAAHRTRTAAVELVTTWFGGADQMREFAEALLAATEN
ncbi:hypothetical protein IRT45_25455 [Nocardia sp. BSTN01]|uniref:hypothetical protein n=1 Tax=Nocardia sp. BSTN01 TaxID=2783665 RepID=UPI00188EB9EB|nr:hypothetical protein [Nocardia sp. BSTN01]MBF5000494.1 hypothetical protein [Nocardia sp. BSTN01]